MKIFCLFPLVLMLMSCAQHETTQAYYESKSEPQKICYGIADRLAGQLNLKRINNAKILKIAFVDIDNIDTVSSTGRAYSEFVASRLCQLGFSVVELKVRTNSIKIAPQGALILSNDQMELAKEHNASAALIGYYKSSNQRDIAIFVRIINITDNTMLAADDFSVW